MACVSSTLTYRTKDRLEFQSVFLYASIQTNEDHRENYVFRHIYSEV